MPPSDDQVLSRLYTRARMPRRTPLERLPFSDQQYYSTCAARSPHGTHLPVESLGITLVPCADLIALCPPDIQPAAGVPWSQPARYPTWIFYPDGRSRCIATPEGLAQQPPGYVCYPHVPFPALEPGSPLVGMGETWYGPFAPHLCGYPPLDSFHPDDLVYATAPLRYGERYGSWMRSLGEYFALEGLFIDADLRKEDKVRPVNPRGQRLPHEATERVFVDEARLAAYAQRHDEWEATGKTAVARPTGRSEEVVPPLSGRPSRMENAERLLDFLAAVEEYIKGYRGKHPDHYPTIEEMRHGVRTPFTGKSSKTFGRWGKDALKLVNSPYRDIKTWMTSLPY